MKTLAGGGEPIDLLFLDGAKQLYLPLFELLRPRLGAGAVVVADNADVLQARPFCEHVRSHPAELMSTSLFGGRMLVVRVE